MRCAVNPENDTEMLFTFDDREPTEDDYDFGADFTFEPETERRVAAQVAQIAQDLTKVAQLRTEIVTLREFLWRQVHQIDIALGGFEHESDEQS